MVATKTTKKNTKARARLDASALEVSQVEDTPGALGGGGIPDDHPLAQAFERSFDHDVEVALTVNDVGLAIKLLQKLANKSGRGLRKSVSGNVITIKVAEKKTRTPKVETAVDPEL